MSKQWQIRRGTTADNDDFTGAIGEVTMDTDKKQLRVHDGQTQGGAGVIDPVVAFLVPSAENNYTWYRKYSSGWVEQGGLCIDASGDGSVSLPITMADTNYHISAINEPTSNENAWGWVYVRHDTKTTTGFGLNSRVVSGTAVYLRARWMVCGMAA